MKKIFFYFMTLSILLNGCKKDTSTEDESRITYYVTFSFSDTSGKDQFGNDIVIIEKGNTYDINENYTAFEGEKDKKPETTISGDLDVGLNGYYPISYSAVNSDEYSAGVTRAVVVADPQIITDISGEYSGTVNRTPTGNTYNQGFDVNIVKVADGVFYIDRLLGSYYYDGLGFSQYGSYFVHGFVSISSNNELAINDGASFSPGWGDSLEGFKEGMYDPTTGVISFTSIYAGGRQFHVTLKKK